MTPTAQGQFSAPKRRRVGVLLPERDGEYFPPILAGVCRAAEALNVDLIFYLGSEPGSPLAFEKELTAVFDLVDPALLDGLLVFASALQVHINSAQLNEFLSHFDSLPMVCVGHRYKDRPAVMLDNYGGFKDLVRHFIVDHGHTQIALVEGPPANRDAQERLQAYLDAHREAGIEPDPALRDCGHYSRYATRDTIARLWSRERPFSAVVCANDEMAYAVLAAAVDRGIEIPGGLAVGGFDDVLGFTHGGPSLSTVSQELDEQGATAMRLLADLADGRPVPLLTTIQTRLVLRQSCGCLSTLNEAASTQVPIEERVHKVARAMDGPRELSATLPDEILGLRDALLAMDAPLFEQRINLLTARWLQYRSSITPLQHLLLSMGQHLLGPMDATTAIWASDRLQRAQIVLVNAVSLSENRKRVHAGDSAGDFRYEFKMRVTRDDLDALLAALPEGLKLLGVENCMIALYKQPLTLEQMHAQGVPATSRLIFALQDGQLHPELANVDFPTCRLAPDDVLNRQQSNSHTVMPMFYLQDHFGFIVVDRQRRHRMPYEELRHELSTYIHHCLLVGRLARAHDLLRSDLARVERDNQTLSHLAMRDELTGTLNRRGFFEMSHTLLADARSSKRPVTLIFADLDDLKSINDGHGHEEGDDAIREAARLLCSAFRQDDIVARIGGDEFVALTPLHSLDGLPEIERRLVSAFDEHNARSGKRYRLGCSIGGYVVAPDSQESLDDILAQADRLLYAAKRRKRAHREIRLANG